jgi:hypothetical protein
MSDLQRKQTSEQGRATTQFMSIDVGYSFMSGQGLLVSSGPVPDVGPAPGLRILAG